MIRARARRVASIATVAVLVTLAASAASAVAADGPAVSIDRRSVSPGETVLVTMTGFKSGLLNVAVCGNLARRGSADCNMQTSKSDQRDRFHDSSLTELVVQPPPVPCPCLIRASSPSQREFAVTPIEVVGHPVGPVVGLSDGPLLEVDVDVQPAAEGFGASLRSAAGGRTRYRVAVSVRNLTTDTLKNVVIRGSAGNRLTDEAASIEFPSVEPLAPGQSWHGAVDAEVPAPVIGRYSWTIVASGAGRPVTAVERVGTMPWALVLLVLVFVLDAIALVWRYTRRARARMAQDDTNTYTAPAAPFAKWEPISAVPASNASS